MSAETRELILAAARPIVQAHGYNGLSFRDLAAAVGIKSASVHYHFPTKGDLGAALAAGYTARARDDLEQVKAEGGSRGHSLRRYAALFRTALENGNRMCLCGILAAEADDLPDPVRDQVAQFAQLNTQWLAGVLAPGTGVGGLRDTTAWARAIFAAISGAQLIARGKGDVRVFDEIVESYRATGLIPD